MCEICFAKSECKHDELADRLCFNQAEHSNTLKTTVAWDPTNKCLVNVKLKPMKITSSHFVLCNSSICRGDECTYPHSAIERDAWNYDTTKEIKSQYR